MEVIKEWIKVILFFVVIFSLLIFLIKLNEEKPHRVIIDGKEYTRMKEWNGNHYQIILLPVDTIIQ